MSSATGIPKREIINRRNLRARVTLWVKMLTITKREIRSVTSDTYSLIRFWTGRSTFGTVIGKAIGATGEIINIHHDILENIYYSLNTKFIIKPVLWIYICDKLEVKDSKVIIGHIVVIQTKFVWMTTSQNFNQQQPPTLKRDCCYMRSIRSLPSGCVPSNGAKGWKWLFWLNSGAVLMC